MLFTERWRKYERSSNYVADGIFGNLYSVHLRYEVGHNGCVLKYALSASKCYCAVLLTNP